MKENNTNPNFDFYSFNAPESPQPTPEDNAAPEASLPEADIPVSEPAVFSNAPEGGQPISDGEARADRMEQRQKLKQSYSHLGWGFVAMTVAWYAVAQVLMDCVYTYAPAIYESYWFSILAGTLPLYLVGVPLLYLIIHRVPRVTLEKKKLKLSHFLILFVIAQMLMLVGNIMGETVVSVLGGITGINFENALNKILDVPLWLSMLTTVIAAPIFEELIFRKLLMDRMLPYGEFAAIMVSSLLFGAFHGNFSQFFYATLLGMLLSFVYARTGNWLHCALMHMLVNFMGGVLPTLITNWLDYETFVTLPEDQIFAYISEHLGAYLCLMGYSALQYGLGIAGAVLLIVNFRKFALRRAENSLSNGDSLLSALTSGGIIAALVACALLFALCILSAWITTFMPMA